MAVDFAAVAAALGSNQVKAAPLLPESPDPDAGIPGARDVESQGAH